VSADSTCLVHSPNGQIRWWTFAGGIANALLADALKPHCDVKADNLSLNFPTASSVDVVTDLIDNLQPDSIRPIPHLDAMENLKFSECLSPDIAAEVFTSRFDDRSAVAQAIEERRRVIVQRGGHD
jgi:ATP-dependent Lhr-like helicase